MLLKSGRMLRGALPIFSTNVGALKTLDRVLHCKTWPLVPVRTTRPISMSNNLSTKATARFRSRKTTNTSDPLNDLVPSKQHQSGRHDEIDHLMLSDA